MYRDTASGCCSATKSCWCHSSSFHGSGRRPSSNSRTSSGQHRTICTGRAWTSICRSNRSATPLHFRCKPGVRTDPLRRGSYEMQRDHRMHGSLGQNRRRHGLTGTELAILERLPKLPATSEISTNRIWPIDRVSPEGEPIA